jgi:hypothetical protein
MKLGNIILSSLIIWFAIHLFAKNEPPHAVFGPEIISDSSILPSCEADSGHGSCQGDDGEIVDQ